MRTLAAPETEGRGSGTPGADRAARHIADELRAAGLRTELQPFPVPTGIRLGPVNTLAVLGPAPQALALGRDWAPLPVSADGAVEGEVVFAGYGITAPDLGWDDYAGLDARGKVVLVLGGDPRPADPGTPFRRPEAYHYAERSHKIINAREHGARAILLVAHPGAPDEALPPLAGIAQPSSIAALVLTRAAADLLLAPAGTRLGELAEAIDRPLQPRAQALAGVRAGLEVSLIYASTHLADAACPAPPDRSRGYVWPLYPGWDIFAADLDGGRLQRLTANGTYDAECAVSPDGRRIVFTSLRGGDLDLYVMDADGGDVRRLTAEPGYDGGPFFSWDGRFIVFRAARPETRAELEEYRALLGRALVRPRRLDVYVMRADGTGLTRATRTGGASFAPFMHPDSQRIVFASNHHDPSGRTFALWLVNVDGSGLERLTWAESFASFPMFSRDGKKLVFCSNRNAAAPRELNVFVADWMD